MTDHSLLFEMCIVGIIGLISIIFCLVIYIKYKEDKNWAIGRIVLLGSAIGLGILVTIFEILWFCMYLGLQV